MPQRCYIHGPTTTAGTCPTCDAMQRDARDAEITRIRARLDEAAKIIAPFARWSNLTWNDIRAAAQWMKENKP